MEFLKEIWHMMFPKICKMVCYDSACGNKDGRMLLTALNSILPNGIMVADDHAFTGKDPFTGGDTVWVGFEDSGDARIAVDALKASVDLYLLSTGEFRLDDWDLFPFGEVDEGVGFSGSRNTGWRGKLTRFKKF